MEKPHDPAERWHTGHAGNRQKRGYWLFNRAEHANAPCTPEPKKEGSMNDLSYLSSPEARRYTVESYDREYKARECKTCIYRLNDHDQEPCDSCDDKSEWKQDRERLNIPGSRAPDNNTRG